MNLGEMIRQVNIDIDDSVTTSDIKVWINRAIDDISLIANKEALYTTVITESNKYSVPTDCRKIQFVFAGQELLDQIPISDVNNTGYKMWNNEISVQNGAKTGDFELYYYRTLNQLVNDSDEPEIEPEFHDLLILYAVAMSQYMDDEMQRQSDAMNRYVARKAEYKRFKARPEPPHEIREVY